MFSRLIGFLFVLTISSSAIGQVTEVPDSSAVTGVSHLFEITNSAFLNVAVESTQEIFAYIKSVPQEILLNIAKPKPEIQSTTLTIKNLVPETRYNLTRNGETEIIVTDELGAYVCEVDLSQPQKMLITPNQ